MSTTEREDDVASHGDASFDRYARLVRRTLGVPVALVSLVEHDRQVFPGAEGLPEPWQSRRETPLSHSFCQYVVADRRPLIVTDARVEDRLADNLAIRDLGVIAYAGWPLTDHTGTVIGSLCAIDDRPRRWTDYDLQNLSDLAAACSAELGQRELARISRDGLVHAQHLHERSRVLLGLSEALAETMTLADVALALERVGLDHLGCSRAGMWLRTSLEQIRTDPAGIGVRELEFVSHPLIRWEQIADYTRIPADLHNPLGTAFRTDRALFFDDRTAQDAVYAATHASTASGEGRAIVPLRDGEQLLGVLVLVWAEPHTFDDELRTTLAAAAAYSSQSVARAMLLEERVQVSSTLQRAMLTELPQLDPLQLAARYRPAASRDQVGGDWYDALVLPDGATALVIGDVVGHDIAAAALMGQLRSTLRTLTWAVDEAPSASVTRLDHAIPELGIDAMASLLFARVDLSADSGATLRWTNAGHPPPLLVDTSGAARWLDATGDLMLGVDPDSPRHDAVVRIDPGATLLLFTDGLVESRGHTITEGLDALAAAVTRHHALPLEGFLDAVLDDLLPDTLRDDVAVLAARIASS